MKTVKWGGWFTEVFMLDNVMWLCLQQSDEEEEDKQSRNDIEHEVDTDEQRQLKFARHRR